MTVAATTLRRHRAVRFAVPAARPRVAARGRARDGATRSSPSRDTFDQPHPVFALVRRDVLPHLAAFLAARRAQDRRVVRDARVGRGRVRRRGRRLSQHQHARTSSRRTKAACVELCRRACGSAISPGDATTISCCCGSSRRCVGDPVPLLRADRPLDRRAAVEGRAGAQPRRARRQDLLRPLGLSGHAELDRAPAARPVRRRARAAHLSGARRCHALDDRARGVVVVPARDGVLHPIRRPATTSGVRPWRWTRAMACRARSPAIRFPTRSTARCGRCRSSCACTWRWRSPASLGLAHAARALAPRGRRA